MRIEFILSILPAPLGVLAAPVEVGSNVAALAVRQARPQKPPPCVRRMNTTEPETKIRSDAFAQAFIYDKDISEAFKYISQDYINHNPAAQNGFDSAWNILSPIWGSQNITPLRTAFKYPQSWLNYRSGFGEVVDRYRWEGGCIVEHVSCASYYIAGEWLTCGSGIKERSFRYDEAFVSGRKQKGLMRSEDCNRTVDSSTGHRYTLS
jgi:predicted SnoaL-like aldol condensation-catalyzing enzyme